MNILIISSNPQRASFRLRIGVNLDILRTNGILCEVARFPHSYLARRKLFQQAAEFDGVLLHKKTLNPFDALWLRSRAKKIIYDFDDAIMYSDKHPGRTSYKRQNSFRRTVKLADMVIADTQYLAEHARDFNKNVEVLPTGLDISAYEVETNWRSDDKIRLVWIGNQSTLKYLAGLTPALEQIGADFDNVVLRIVCDAFFDLKNMQVEKRRWSLKTQAVDLVTSHIGLAPMPDNRFTQSRFCFKILQYAAAGLPTIASPVGANTQYVREGCNGFLASDSADWIDKISRLENDSQLRNQLGQAGKADVQQFDLKVLGKQLANLIKRCLEKA